MSIIIGIFETVEAFYQFNINLIVNVDFKIQKMFFTWLYVYYNRVVY